ncbi:MAG: VacJ family lipoprotein [Rickettsiella sp.]|nr:VacJ family lipoprotein [Rickettsiella sp.]
MLNKTLGLCLLLILASPSFAKDATNDPYENYNRHAFKLNQTLDKIFFKPIATVYKTILPWPITKGISNFFSNLEQVPTIINDLLQADFYGATGDTWRLLINSTIGIGGFIDVASRINLPPHAQDFGLTLAKWGYKSSAYFVVPILGPRTIRDAISWPINYGVFSVYPYINDMSWRNGLSAGSFINARAQLLDFDQTIRQVSFDPYVFQRNAYLQRRNYLIRQNSNLVSLSDDDDDDDDDE